MQETVTIQFTPSALKYVMDVLGTRPYNETAALIGDLMRQLQLQQQGGRSPQSDT